MNTELQVPNRDKDPITKDGALMSKQFAKFLELATDVLNHVQIGDGDPTGTLETKRKMIFIRQDGGVGSTLYVNEVGDGTSAGWRAL